MKEPRDAYKVLQVDHEADLEVIQAAYRRLAQKFHPDRGGGQADVERMVALNRAWELLSDPARRAAHDRERQRMSTTRTTPDARTSDDFSRPVSPAPSPAVEPTGPVLTFGRYAGMSLRDVARHDLEYLEWLDRMPIGRPWRTEIDGLLRAAGRRTSPDLEAARRRGLFRRR
jgi:curved DNA-binding protein CbpA